MPLLATVFAAMEHAFAILAILEHSVKMQLAPTCAPSMVHAIKQLGLANAMSVILVWIVRSQLVVLHAELMENAEHFLDFVFVKTVGEDLIAILPRVI